jgi:hypothetical protein
MAQAGIFLELILYQHRHRAVPALIAMAMVVVVAEAVAVLLAAPGVIWDTIISEAELVGIPEKQPAGLEHRPVDPRLDQIHNIGPVPMVLAEAIGKPGAVGV